MIIKSQKITIVSIRKPSGHNINKDLQYFGSALGLFGLRDKDKSCFRIFIELIKAAKQHQPLTSDELAARLNLTRGTVVHHLHKLIEAGIVVQYKNKYILRVDNLEALIEELQKDIIRTTDDLKNIAMEIDRALGL
ncbi:helix-turn-helix domain-containing protein [Candidatus Woesearchaeota archaeon]|nr:helix-turn-helix domain-containing protein [Candidatus Woesearchaeota archaeon]MBW3022070.1 helix-turn-helix domain-containing protein [Candidatus Woesearchaeota archaeon]